MTTAIVDAVIVDAVIVIDAPINTIEEGDMMRVPAVNGAAAPRIGLVCGLALAAIAMPAAALDQCLLSCDAEFGGCANNPDPAYNCGLSLSGCYGRCQGSSNGGGAQQSFGAISISPSTMVHGYSYGFGSQAQAESAAIQYCRDNQEHPGDCKSVLWFYDTCGALAIAPHGKNDLNYWGSAWADSKRSAERQAMSYCAENGVRGCRIAVSYCSR